MKYNLVSGYSLNYRVRSATPSPSNNYLYISLREHFFDVVSTFHENYAAHLDLHHRVTYMVDLHITPSNLLIGIL
jgi:hypothetical protein